MEPITLPTRPDDSELGHVLVGAWVLRSAELGEEYEWILSLVPLSLEASNAIRNAAAVRRLKYPELIEEWAKGLPFPQYSEGGRILFPDSPITLHPADHRRIPPEDQVCRENTAS